MLGSSCTNQQVSQARGPVPVQREPNTGKRESKVWFWQRLWRKADVQRDVLFVEGFYLVVGKEWQICNTIFLQL